jgi:signal transduction histidine kinase
MFNQQVNTWNSVFPQNALSNLMDSDHFSVSKQLKFIESTGLFSSFVITDNQKRIISRFGVDNLDESRLIPIVDSTKVVWGYYSFTTNFYKYFSPFLIAIVIFSGLVLLIYFSIRFKIRTDLEREFFRFNQFLNEIERVTESLPEIYNEKNIGVYNSNFTESTEQEIINRAISRLFQEINKAQNSLRQAILKTEQQKFEEELTRTALQVAHDVGSPIAALETLLEFYSHILPEESRVSARNAVLRIRDIANSLLKKTKQDLLSIGNESLSQQFISSLIKHIVSEKRLQYQGKPISINYDSKNEVYDLFAMVKTADFSRVLSNLINNSVDALDDNGQISISLAESINLNQGMFPYIDYSTLYQWCKVP